jgi:hypothetical protein
MSPVRARRISAEPLDEGLRRAGARRRVEDLAVIQPSLEVIGRGLHYYCRLEPLGFYPLDSFRTKVVDEAQGMDARGSDVDMSALGIFVTEPLDGSLDLVEALPFSQNHLAGIAPDTDIETLAAHRAQLYAHQPFDNNGRFLAALFPFNFRHFRHLSLKPWTL